MAFETFEDLEVWKISRQLKIEIQVLVKSFPKEKKYRLTDQIIRGSRSVSANIAEGFGRYHFKENTRFCYNARGGLFETLNHLIDTFDTNYITQEKLLNYKMKILHCNKVLNGYISYLKKQSVSR